VLATELFGGKSVIKAELNDVGDLKFLFPLDGYHGFSEENLCSCQ
jgi:hypothetical protein